MKQPSKKTLALGTLAGSLALGGGAFAMTPLESAYMGPPAHGQHAEGRCGFKHMDRDGDGRISREEFAAAHDGKDEKFAAHDLDGDGAITEAEMDAHHASLDAEAEAAKAKQAEGKCGEGRCGEGRCGANPQPTKGAEGKCGEGKCGAGKCGSGG